MPVRLCYKGRVLWWCRWGHLLCKAQLTYQVCVSVCDCMHAGKAVSQRESAVVVQVGASTV